MAETIKQWADRKRVSVTLGKQILRDLFPTRDFRSPDRRLDKEEAAGLEAEHSRRTRAATAVAVESRVEPESAAASPDPILNLAISAVGVGTRKALRSVRFQLHADFVEWLSGNPPASQRAATLRALECMVANGRPNRVKSVKGVNQGWLRTPVGGTGGMQWYLWFVGRGAKPVGDRLSQGEFLIRAVRHHDDTGEHIAAGTASDWMPWSPHDLIDEYDRQGPEVAAPLSSAQIRAIASANPVQILRGTPGAGKTTALLHGVRRLPGRVLYLTYGRALADRARNWLRSFATGDSQVVVEAISDVLGMLATAPAPRDPPLAQFRAELSRALDPRLRDLGPWCDASGLDHVALYDELHGQLFGRVTCGASVGLRPDSDRPMLPREADYVALRRPVIGEHSARTAWKAASFLDDGTIRSLFPGPTTARRASQRLLRGEDTGKLGVPDWIVIDEVQDLTLVEAEVIVELARATAKTSGKRPGLRFAGDEGQTLRPTGFTWADLKVLLSQRIAEPESSVLDCNLRSAREVAVFVEQLTRSTYPRLAKGLRPGGQKRADIDPVEGGEVAVLRVPRAALPEVMAAAKSAGAIIQPGREIPEFIAQAAKEAGVVVHTGESAKGLDFDSVVVIGLGEFVARMHTLAHAGDVVELAAEQARSLADHARVAASRAVSRLVLVELSDGDPGDGARAALDSVFAVEVSDLDGDAPEGIPESISMEILAERLEADTGDAISRLTEALRLAEHLLDRDPAAAANSADEAVKWLKRSGRTSAIGEDLRRQVHRARARARVAVALQGILAEGARDQLWAAQRSFRSAGDDQAAERVGDLARLLRPSENGVAVGQVRDALLARAMLEVGRDENPWLHAMLSPVVGARLGGLLDDTNPKDSLQARGFVDLLTGMTVQDQAQQQSLQAALMRSCDVLAQSPQDARIALQTAAGRGEPGWLRVVARALTSLGDPQAPAAWAAAGDAPEGLATLRSWGKLREAAAFSEQHGLPAPPTVVAALRALSAVEAIDANTMTAEERRTVLSAVESRLGADRPVRGRRS